MTRALVIYCHPCEGSFTAAVRDVVLDRLSAAGAEFRLRDLYAKGFDPVLSASEHRIYDKHPGNCGPVQQDVDDLLWCDTLIFVYPTWWFSYPAVLKGWLDRVLLPGVAFHLPDETNPQIRPALTHIHRLGVFTTCGASRWVTLYVGAPGKRVILRGIARLCGRPLKKTFLAQYLMDTRTEAQRKRHLDLVRRKMDRFLATRIPERTPR